MPNDIAESLQRTLRRLWVTTVVLVAALGAAVGWFAIDSANQRTRIGDVADRSNMALCALRGNLKRQIAASEAFLLEHPDGFAGISAATIRAGIANQQQTVVALAALDCGTGGD